VLFPAHLGAAEYIMNKLRFIPDTFVGTSGGSIVAACLASGMTTPECLSLATQVLPKNTLALNRKFWQPARSIGLLSLDKMADIIEKKTKVSAQTFRKSLKNLIIVANDVEGKRPFYFSEGSSPEVKISTAIKASSAVPFLFAPVEVPLYPTGKYPTGKKLLLNDGGVSQNLATDIFNEEDDVIGIRFSGEGIPKKVSSRLDYILNTVSSMLYEEPKYADLIVNINVPYEPFDFGLEINDVVALYQMGYKAAEEQLYLNPRKENANLCDIVK